MPSLIEELDLETVRPTQCRMCRFLSGLTDDERAEWHLVLIRLDPTTGRHRYDARAISRALARRDLILSNDAIQHHRRNHEPS